VNDIALSLQVTAADMGLVQPVKQLIQALEVCLQPVCLCNRGLTHTGMPLRRHDGRAGHCVDISIEHCHHLMNRFRLLIRPIECFINLAGLNQLTFDWVCLSQLNIFLKRIYFKWHLILRCKI
jgi:hypothetical protein